MATDPMFQEAQNAFAAGQHERAKDLLTRLLRKDQNNAEYWLWMSTVVESPGERVFCLEKAIKLDPNNVAVRRGLVLHGALPPNDNLPPAAPVRRRRTGDAADQRVSVKVSVDGLSSFKGGGLQQLWSRPVVRYSLFGAGGLAALVIIVLIIVSAVNGRPQQVAQQSTRRPSATAPSPTNTLLPTASPVVKSPTPTFIGPTPLWMFLEATYTPTPRYIETPHAIIESFRAGLRAYDRGDYLTMAQHMAQASRDDPGSPDILYYLGEAYRLQGKYQEAINTFSQAITVNAGFAPPYLGRARARLALNPATDVSKDLAQAIEIDPRFQEAYLERASFLINNGDPDGAMEDLAIAETIPPPAPMLYVLRAEARLILDDAPGALEDALKAHEMDFTLLPAYLTLGRAYLANENLAQAKNNIEIYLRYIEENPQAYVMMGSIYYESAEYEDALEAYDQALKLDEDLIIVYWYRGRVYIELGDGQKAVNDIVKAQRQNTQSFLINVDLGRAFMVAERLNDAYRQLTLANNLAQDDSQHAVVYYWRAQVLELAGNPRGAKDDWENLLALPPEAVPPEWITIANEHMLILVSPTPSATVQATATETPLPSSTPSPTVTPSPTATPSATPTPSPTLRPTSAPRTPTPTR